MKRKRSFKEANSHQVSGGTFALIFLGFLGFICFVGFLMATISYKYTEGAIADLDANGYMVKATIDPLTKYLRKESRTGNRASSSTWEHYACLRPPQALNPKMQQVWDRASKNSDFPNRRAFLERMEGRIIEHLTEWEFNQFKDQQVVDFQFKQDCWRIVRPYELHYPVFFGSIGGMLLFWGLLVRFLIAKFRFRRNVDAP